MSRNCAWLMLWIGIFIEPLAWAIDQPLTFRDAAEEARFRVLATELRCLVCQNQSIEASHAPLAHDLRNEVLRLMREGRTDEQVRQHLTERYGDFVLYRPPVSPATYLLWFGPLSLLLIATLYALRRWRKLHSTQEPALDHSLRERLLEQLRETRTEGREMSR